ncbi:hypothetical protein DOTSEDRAFT_53489 [Dothistroma septosporum NZE10]|uniref:F-box domain-containing protein n=1 Tax=Dothistroma septosporum (strain NZE10 / CBS 128990) TaxID=675120 RepID=N1PN70_DOTSN|nr:hypothetical protein DOTSEDRAFT_53489 [Dothistroma septosporum NZE10]
MKRSRSGQNDEGDYQPTAKRSTKRRVKRAPSLRVTRLMKVDAARRAVFETVELLENIFVQLPSREVILCVRVCRQFQQVINSSHKIQRKLFRNVDDTSEEWVVCPTFDPHTSSLWPNVVGYHFESDAASSGDQRDSETCYQVSQLNTAIFTRPSGENDAFQVWLHGGAKVYVRSELTHILLDMIKGKPMSCSDMHITSPPCRSACIRLRLRLSGKEVCRINKHILAASGITIGELATQLSTSRGGGDFGNHNAREVYHHSEIPKRLTNRAPGGVSKDASGPMLRDYVAECERKTGRSVEVHSGPIAPWLYLPGVVLPTDKEMAEVRGRASNA